jgi:Domain of unknown function (DUF4301)
MSKKLQPSSPFPDSLEKQLKACGLDTTVVAGHRENVLSHLLAGTPRFFPISDTCRIDNGGICVLPTKKVLPQERKSIVGFVPAAGASSRYLAPLISLMEAVTSRNADACRKEIELLRSKGFLDCPLPSSLKNLVEFLGPSAKIIPEELAMRVVSELEAPKALYPVILDGTTFLKMKYVEHQAVDRLSGEVYICPPLYADRFLTHLSPAETKKSNLKIQVYEQDVSLATTRFDANGAVALDQQGQVSTVPAGHGALLELMPRITQDFEGARGIFIRNIDNVSGKLSAPNEASQLFLDAFSWTLGQMDELRLSIIKNDLEGRAIIANRILGFWGLPPAPSNQAVATLMTSLFHATPESIQRDLKALVHRPLVLMGQVPNTGHDVGGTCVFTTVDGQPQKLCLEVPHASSSDKTNFLENPSKATHFNPVFVAAEIPTAEGLNRWKGHPFWLIAKKHWRGAEAYYQESILYEILGSSHYVNLIFVEVPRLVFNPHKTLKDASLKGKGDWGLE